MRQYIIILDNINKEVFSARYNPAKFVNFANFIDNFNEEYNQFLIANQCRFMITKNELTIRQF
jgi:hypothetical protein